MVSFPEYVLMQELQRQGVNGVPGDVDSQRNIMNGIADPNKDPEAYKRMKQCIEDNFGSVSSFLNHAKKDPSLWAKVTGAAHGLAQGAEEPRKMLY